MNLHLIFLVVKLFTLEFKLEHQITEVLESIFIDSSTFIPIINLVLDSEGIDSI